VNIIPVIAKADTMTEEEVTQFKRQIMSQIASAKIRVYEFPDDVDGEESARKDNQRMKERVPFAVVGSNCVIEAQDGKKVRGRKYPWGVVDVSDKIMSQLETLSLYRSRIWTIVTSCPCATCSSELTCKI